MNLRQLCFSALCGILLLSVLTTSCKKDEKDHKQVAEYSAEAALEWNKLFLDVERYAAGYRPGPAPRSLALMGLAIYEACVTGMPSFNSLESRYDGLNIPDVESGKEYHWPTVVNAVYATMMPQFFTAPPADEKAKMDALTADLYADFQSEVSTEVFERSKAYGISVGNAVWDWGTTDPYGHDAYKNPFGNFTTGEEYDWQAHYDGPGDWEPTVPGPGKGMGPFFGKARTFAITEADKLCAPPLPYSEDPHSALFAQALETYNAIDDTNWPDGQWIGYFWSDDLLNLTFSPGPRWIAIANQVIDAEGTDLETSLFCYAKVGMALNDAAVACWHSKYIYNVERPESYIKRLIDPNWEPTLNNPLTGDNGMTPSFPAYPSGHSTMGGAGAEVLTEVFGNHYEMQDNCHLGRTEFNGTPRYFDNFYQMAEENAISRVPLGVHFRMDCRTGVDLGYHVGRRVNKLPWRK